VSAPVDPDEPFKPATPISDEGPPAAHESIEHLRAAARELIAAARSALDAAEEFVDSPETSASLSEVAETVSSFVRSVVPVRRNAPAQGEDDDDPDDSGIERIPVT
jgi:hypothetical protein